MIFLKGKKVILFLFFFVFLQSCASSYANKEIYGAGEFVLDSYKIQEGKFAILEMQGDLVVDEEEQEDFSIKEKNVQLVGLVENTTVEIKDTMRLFDVLAAAKISPNANLFGSYLMRKGKVLEIDFVKLLNKADRAQNIFVEPGDQIYISPSSYANVLVMGEVGCKRVIPLPNGFIPIREALAKAGGIAYTGDKSYIQVVRSGIAKPKIYVLNWKHILDLPNSSLLLMPGDMVYVGSKPITEWGRFFSQLIPFFHTSFSTNCSGLEKSN